MIQLPSRDPNLTPEYRDALAELARTNPRAFAEVVTTYVDPVFLTLDIGATFMGTREMKFGDILVKNYRGKYHVHQLVPGQITLGEQIVQKEVALTINLDRISAKATYNTADLENGGPNFTPEKIRSDIQAVLKERLTLRTWNALANIWTASNSSALTISGSSQSNYISVSGPLTSTALDAAIDHVNFWAEGGVKTIIGTEAALAPLSTFGQYQMISGPNSDSYVTQNGVAPLTFNNVSPYNGFGVETYRGVTNIVRIKQIFDKTETPWQPLLPTDFVLVVGNNIGEFITYGEPGVKEYIDNEPTPPYWNYETWLQYGMIIDNAMGLVKIKINTPTIP